MEDMSPLWKPSSELGPKAGGKKAKGQKGKLTHYAVDHLGNWCPSKLRGHVRVAVSASFLTLPSPTCTRSHKGGGRGSGWRPAQTVGP